MKEYHKMNKFEFLKEASPETKKLFEQLLQLKSDLNADFTKFFNRSLPFGEMLSNRWGKAKHLSFGEGTSVYDDVLIFGNVKVGSNTWIGPYVILDGSGGLQIGSHCSISSGAQIYSHNTVKWALSGGKSNYEYKATSIGSNSFIGPMCIVQMGVSIGSNCLVAANSFVNKNVPSFSIVAGTPAKLIGEVRVDKDGQVELVYQ